MNNGKKRVLGLAFWKGFFSVFDLWGTSRDHESYEYNADDLSPEELDYQAIKKDWEMVGQDLQSAITQYGQEK
jgi:hypothetical protein